MNNPIPIAFSAILSYPNRLPILVRRQADSSHAKGPQARRFRHVINVNGLPLLSPPPFTLPLPIFLSLSSSYTSSFLLPPSFFFPHSPLATLQRLHTKDFIPKTSYQRLLAKDSIPKTLYPRLHKASVKPHEPHGPSLPE